MSNKEETITIIVQNTFGRDKEMSKKEFVKRWRTSVTDLHDIATNREDDIRVVNIIENVEAMASRRFDHLWTIQNK